MIQRLLQNLLNPLNLQMCPKNRQIAKSRTKDKLRLYYLHTIHH